MNPIKLEIYKSLFTALCDEMGEVLKRSSFSPNIKERLDFSCALFNKNAELIAQAAHIPVHLGSMGMSVIEAIKYLKNDKKQNIKKGDVIITNDPYRGGTHLPDITIITPVFLKNKNTPSFYLANRAHHSDIGGLSPGSMPLSDSIEYEGLYLKPDFLKRKNKIQKKLYDTILKNTRTVDERKGDLNAQLAANHRGEIRLLEIIEKYGAHEVSCYMNYLLDYEERLTRSVFKKFPQGSTEFIDYLDDDGFSQKPIAIHLKLTFKNSTAIFDFSKSDDQCRGPFNATRAITLACLSYVLRCLMQTITQSPVLSLRPVKLVTRKNSIVDASYPHAVAAGNVETSQRIVDVILGAFSKIKPDLIPAASNGSMNNISFGGYDTFRQRNFAYYETIGGGMGAHNTGHGSDGIHSHMTNTLNTPIEVLENEFPIRICEYSLRKNSGGIGKFNGGQGLIREFEFLTPVELTLLTERRIKPPYGLKNGKSAKSGKNILISNNKQKILKGKIHLKLKQKDRIRLETPGGGGYGKK